MGKCNMNTWPSRWVWSAMAVVLFLGIALGDRPVSAQAGPSPLYLPKVMTGQEADPDPLSQYIVLLAEDTPGQVSAAGAASVAQAAGALVAEYGGSVSYTYTHVVHGYAAEMSASAAAELARDPAVAMVDPDQVLTVSGLQSPAPWGLDRIDKESLPLDDTYRY